MIDYPKRIQQARERMVSLGIDAMFLPQGANLLYLTGIARADRVGTDSHAHGDWANGAFIFADKDLVISSPRAGLGRHVGLEGQELPWVTDVVFFVEGEDPLTALEKVLSGRQKANGKVAVDDRAWAETLLALQELLPKSEFVKASLVTAPMRAVKDPDEVELMIKAGEITDQAFEAAIAMLRPGVTEMDVAAEIDLQFKRLGAQYNSFASGVRFVGPGRPFVYGPLRSSRKELTHGDSITFDVGCVYDGYCSDFGRSAFVGEPPAEYQRIHKVVLEAEQIGMETLKPGATASQVVGAVQKHIMDQGYPQDVKHAVGHAIGVNVHEEPILSNVDYSPIELGMTFALEPSVRLDDYLNRVEDVVQVRDDGAEHLYRTDRRLYLIE